MAKDDLEYKLRLEIKEQLTKVTKANSPNIWSTIHKTDGTLSLNGYVRVEARLIQKIIAGQLTPAAAVPQLESEMEE